MMIWIENILTMLFRSVLSCIRLLWADRRFFYEEHGSHVMAAVLRALAHYANTASCAAVDLCLHFLCDLLDGYVLKTHEYKYKFYCNIRMDTNLVESIIK
jgi:hypothetical protein